ncbi:MAG: hypothetical protein U1E15_04820 [Hyphomicrobiales bacterium]
MKKLSAFAMLCLASASGQALAAATPDQAAAIASAFEAYTGGTPGVVTVTPKGDDYEIKLDAGPIIAKNAAPNVSVEVPPYVFLARPNGDGTWAISSSGNYGITIKTPDAPEISFKATGIDSKGTYDEKLGGFTSSDVKIGPTTITEIIKDPSGMVMNMSMAIQSMTHQATGADNGSGAINADSTMTYTGLAGTVKTEGAPGAEVPAGALNYSFNVPEVKYVTAMKGFKSKAVMDLIAFAIANGEKSKLAANQAQFKDKITAALPLWDSIDSTTNFGKVDVNTAIGPISLANAGGGVTMSGISEKGMLREAFNFSGLSIPPGIAPPWSEGLIPHTFKLDFALDGFNLDAPARLALAQADFSKEPPLPESANMAMLPAFAPNNSIGLTFKDGEISAPDFKFTYEGAFTVGFAGFPSGTANLHMTGLETVISKVQAATASDPSAQQTMGGLVALKGFGKAEADGSMSWAIEMKPEGKVLINGLDVSGMMGLAPPQQ